MAAVTVHAPVLGVRAIGGALAVPRATYYRKLRPSHGPRRSTSRRALSTAERTGEDVDPAGLVLHSDNGGPMKGSTMLATLKHLGIVPSFSRPSVSDDNPFIESLFRTLKYRPEYPHKPFETIEAARAWVTAFVAWYNAEWSRGTRNWTPASAVFLNPKRSQETIDGVLSRATS